MLIGTLAIAGIPGFAGFFSKDAILWETWSREAGAYRYLWYIAFLTALMTSFYMFRLIYLTFFGKPRMRHEVEHHIHESPKSMTVPLIILAICCCWRGLPGYAAQPGRIEPLREVPGAGVRQRSAVLEAEGHAAQVAAGEKQVEHTDPLEYALMFASVGAAIVGWWLAQRAYKNADKGYKEPIQEISPRFYKTLFRKWYVDEIYDWLVHRPRKDWRRAPGRAGTRRRPVEVRRQCHRRHGERRGLDDQVFSGTLSAGGTSGLSTASGVNGPAILARMLSYPVRLFEWGLVQWYALVMVAGLVGFVFYYVVKW